MDKCIFATSEEEFVGHIVSVDGRSAIPGQWTKFLVYKSLQTESSCYVLWIYKLSREYIPRMADIAETLYMLTRNGVERSLGSSVIDAFRALKQQLINSGIKYP